jgi:integrase/recombinase XerD
LDAYLNAAKLSDQPEEPLFRSMHGRSRELGLDVISRKDAWAQLKRRLRDAGLSTIYSNHSFRAAGITSYLENGGSLEVAQRIAGQADSRTKYHQALLSTCPAGAARRYGADSLLNIFQ